MEQLLTVNDLNKSYKKSEFQLSNISFSIDPQEVVGLIGKNGSGKSTLINTLVGNRFKDSGSIKFFDQDISQNNNHYKEYLGVVFDDLRVPNKLTITEMDKVFSNIFTTWDQQKFFDTIRYFDLPLKQQLSSFSRGMRMKAALAIALAHDTKLLILDEATAGMDISGREEVLELLEDYIAQGHGVMMSSHISEDIEQIATKLIFMKDGEIVLTEDKHRLLNSYGIIEQTEETVNIPDDIVVASRVRNNTRTTLINDRSRVLNAQSLQSIDDATKLVMRGDI
ncbi:ABC transporter ATP-binding protein [Staphylococcus arlettae]|uniref:ABC transporter ATP-binding protein n=2 Tax=Staphylococcus arlettae TaxID=29378 RepID=UPI000D19C88C|nr:ABC transporter ATP-binding protein [Staphylococcus arlettae]MBF0737161.1 ABC transporter ATP-binding protein [Staphylococcus arlettae]MCP8713498.1 ABC transporter ATP-binding protein [Staphylococcus arlettae]MDN0187032.1 ABC transporter ATP-binding protein [Staphylococcus arlettae]MDT4050177.1 ABC transporter ATP-binding protein [Staphylococcus arlettae]PTH24366.1 ABC transporter ATP-binding protein [Staphylococcus arlettae]